MNAGQEVATAYAALALYDGEVEVNSENLATLLEATGHKVEPYWPMLFAGFLNGKIDDLVMSIGGGGAAAAAAPAAGGAAAEGGEAAAEEAPKEKEEPEEVDLGGGMDMFGGGDDY